MLLTYAVLLACARGRFLVAFALELTVALNLELIHSKELKLRVECRLELPCGRCILLKQRLCIRFRVQELELISCSVCFGALVGA